MIARRWPPLLALVVAVAWALLACGSDADASGPPDIELGRDTCDECHMIISEVRYATAYRDAEGTPFVFDDMGDMLTHAVDAGVLDTMTAWVHDYDTEEWIDAPDAWIVRSDLVTPMAGGMVAFTDRAAAEAFAEERGGEVVSWSQLLDAARAGETSAPDRTTAPAGGGNQGSDPGAAPEEGEGP